MAIQQQQSGLWRSVGAFSNLWRFTEIWIDENFKTLRTMFKQLWSKYKSAAGRRKLVWLTKSVKGVRRSEPDHQQSCRILFHVSLFSWTSETYFLQDCRTSWMFRLGETVHFIYFLHLLRPLWKSRTICMVKTLLETSFRKECSCKAFTV